MVCHGKDMLLYNLFIPSLKPCTVFKTVLYHVRLFLSIYIKYIKYIMILKDIFLISSNFCVEFANAKHKLTFDQQDLTHSCCFHSFAGEGLIFFPQHFWSHTGERKQRKRLTKKHKKFQGHWSSKKLFF